MKAFLSLFVVAALPAVVSAQGFQLAPGEVLVSVNGVPVNRGQTIFPAPIAESRSTSTSAPITPQATSSYSTPAVSVSLAQSKADRMASSGTMGHLGGGFGGGRAEGVGTGSTRQAAIQNCCYWGQRTPLDIGTATNGSRWYACVIYR